MTKKLLDTYSDKKIKVCIRGNRSFSVIAGAGSGKTTSLIKALEYVRDSNGRDLRKCGRKVACVTFTNRAVEVIKKRLNLDDLFYVSTLHGFLWSLIGGFNADIRQTLKEVLIPQRIEKKKQDDNGGASKVAQAARKKVEELTADLQNIDNQDVFTYDESGSSNYSEGRLDHDDVIDLAAAMLSRYPILQKVVGQKYPYIFVDEAQDTFPHIVEALNLIASNNTQTLTGYFGDPMQQIYEKRAGDFRGGDKSAFITKKENYRCSTEVIKLLNAFRPELQQQPAGNNAQGSVGLILIQAEEGQGNRKTYTDEQLENARKKFEKAVQGFGWEHDTQVKMLFLARQMIARRLGFSSLNKLFTGEYASRNAQDDYEDGKHYLLLPITTVLLPLVAAYRINDRVAQMEILRSHSPLLNPRGEFQATPVKEVIEMANKAIKSIADGWDTDNIGTILRTARENKLIHCSDRLTEQLTRQPRTEQYNEESHAKEKGDWLADQFFASSTSELAAYLKFIKEETPYSTQHGVKGEEYKKVLVVFDDTEASWAQYSFSRLIAPIAAGKDPTDGQRERSRKLAYVCFSRAEDDLRIILFTPNPEQAKTEIIQQRLLSEGQIVIQK